MGKRRAQEEAAASLSAGLKRAAMHRAVEGSKPAPAAALAPVQERVADPQIAPAVPQPAAALAPVQERVVGPPIAWVKAQRPRANKRQAGQRRAEQHRTGARLALAVQIALPCRQSASCGSLDEVVIVSSCGFPGARCNVNFI